MDDRFVTGGPGGGAGNYSPPWMRRADWMPPMTEPAWPGVEGRGRIPYQDSFPTGFLPEEPMPPPGSPETAPWGEETYAQGMEEMQRQGLAPSEEQGPWPPPVPSIGAGLAGLPAEQHQLALMIGYAVLRSMGDIARRLEGGAGPRRAQPPITPQGPMGAPPMGPRPPVEASPIPPNVPRGPMPR